MLILIFCINVSAGRFGPAAKAASAIAITPVSTDETVDLGFPSINVFDKRELGSIPMPEANTCVLGQTQYTVSLAESTYCDWGTGWNVSVEGDQKLNLYVRLGQRVAVEDGKVVADFASRPPTGNATLSLFSSISPTPMVRTYFIAVENCSSSTASYSLVFRPYIPDLPPPSITNLFFEGKNLHVMGYFLGPGSTVLFDGEPQKTKYGGSFNGRHFTEDLLIVKKGRKTIRPGATISVKLNTGCVTRPWPNN
jgi:hypothetical protein